MTYDELDKHLPRFLHMALDNIADKATQDTLQAVWGVGRPLEILSHRISETTTRHQIVCWEKECAQNFLDILGEDQKQFLDTFQTMGRMTPLKSIFPSLSSLFNDLTGYTYFLAACHNLNRGDIPKKFAPHFRRTDLNPNETHNQKLKKLLHTYFSWEPAPAKPENVAAYLSEQQEWSALASHQSIMHAVILGLVRWEKEGVFPCNMTTHNAIANLLTNYPEGLTAQQICEQLDWTLCSKDITPNIVSVKRTALTKNKGLVVGLRKQLYKHKKYIDLPEAEARSFMEKVASFVKNHVNHRIDSYRYWKKFNPTPDYGTFIIALRQWGQIYHLHISEDVYRPIISYTPTISALLEKPKSAVLSALENLSAYQQPTVIHPLFMELVDNNIFAAAVLYGLVVRQSQQNSTEDYFMLSQDDRKSFAGVKTQALVDQALAILKSNRLIHSRRNDQDHGDYEYRLNNDRLIDEIKKQLVRETSDKTTISEIKNVFPTALPGQVSSSVSGVDPTTLAQESITNYLVAKYGATMTVEEVAAELNITVHEIKKSKKPWARNLRSRSFKPRGDLTILKTVEVADYCS